MVLALYICGLITNIAVGIMVRAAAGISVRAATRAARGLYRVDARAAFMGIW